MSVYGKWVAATIAATASESSAIDLGREYDFLSLQIPEMDNCILYLKVAEIEGGTYYDLVSEEARLTIFNEANELEEGEVEEIESKGNRADVWRLGGWRFIKVVSSVAQSAERLIRVCGMRY